MSSIPVRLPRDISTEVFTCVFFLRAIDANRTQMFSAGWEAETSASHGVSVQYSLFQVGRRFGSRETLVFAAGALT